MKIDRQLGILTILLQRGMATAPELAERFEVSRRTINRDIDDLCRAGIPLQTLQGVGGGIRIMEGYSIDRTLLTSKDLKMIMAGLRSLDSISGSHYYAQLMEKLKSGASQFVTGTDSILIDLSGRDREAASARISLIQGAIDAGCVLAFDYYGPKGESHRELEPYYLIFKWSSWYVYGYCRLRQDYRLFKLSRMRELRCTQTHFSLQPAPMPDLTAEQYFPSEYAVEAIADAQLKWRLIEDFGPDCFETRADGRLYVHGIRSDLDGLIAWALTCGDKIQILKPREARSRLLAIAKGIQSIYEEEALP